MNTIWHTENDRLACRWSELPQSVPYNPGWMQEGTTIAEPPAPYFLDFRRLSALGGARWFERILEPFIGAGTSGLGFRGQ